MDWAIFTLAERFGTDPCVVAHWPAHVFLRARMYAAAHNQAEADRAANAQAQADAERD